jgi:hypothetical protein
MKRWMGGGGGGGGREEGVRQAPLFGPGTLLSSPACFRCYSKIAFTHTRARARTHTHTLT